MAKLSKEQKAAKKRIDAIYDYDLPTVHFLSVLNDEAAVVPPVLTPVKGMDGKKYFLLSVKKTKKRWELYGKEFTSEFKDFLLDLGSENARGESISQ